MTILTTDFTCARCHKTFPLPKDWTHEKAMKELKANGMGGTPLENLGIICGKCNAEIMPRCRRLLALVN